MNLVTGVILAGGTSTRFGSDKLAHQVGGQTLLQKAVSSVRQASDRVVVALSADGPSPDVGEEVTFARDSQPGQGPLQGVLAGLQAAGAGIAVVVGGDMPSLSPEVLRHLVALVQDAGEASVLQDHTARAGFRPLPMAVSVTRAIPVVQSLLGTGKRSLYGLAEALHPAILPEKTWTALDPERGSLKDVDEPSDLGLG